MQPQWHVQVLLSMVVFGFNPQEALDAPRVCIGAGLPHPDSLSDCTIHLEDGISEATAGGLQARGHVVKMVSGWQRSLFGRGQLIRVQTEDGKLAYSAGSDPRGDGAAVAF